MGIRRFSILALVLMGGRIVSVGQNPPVQTPDADRSTPAPALTGLVVIDATADAGDTSSDLPQIPSLLGGKGASLAFPSESERSNYLRGGLNVGATYDDNVLLAPGNGVGNTTYSVFPNIAIEQTLPRLRWSLGYAGGLTVNQRLSNRNQGSHALNFESQFRLSPHVNLRIAEDFLLTSGVFDATSGAGGVVGAGGPNSSLITPLSQQRSSSTVVETNYHFALKDVLGASGSFYDLHFNDVPAGVTLNNTRAITGSAFWLHELFRHDWAGVSYRFERLTFNPSGAETRVHSFMVVNTLNLPGRMTLSGFAGPEYSNNRGLVVSGGTGQASVFSDWSFAAGVEGGWQKERTSLAAGYSRRVNDGGGVLGPVHSQSIHADLRYRLATGWAAALGGSYGRNSSLTVTSATSATSVNVTSVGTSLERAVGKSLGFRVGYSHDFQQQSGSSDQNQDFDAHRNRFFVTLSYQWARPLGR